MKASRPRPLVRNWMVGRGAEHGRDPDQVDRPQHGPVDGAQPTDHHHRDHQDGVGRVEGGRREPFGGEGQADPGVAGDEPGQREGQQLGAGQRDPDGPCAGLVVPHGHQPAGHPAVPPEADHQHREHQDGQREPGERARRCQLDAEEARAADEGRLGVGEAGAHGLAHHRKVPARRGEDRPHEPQAEGEGADRQVQAPHPEGRAVRPPPRPPRSPHRRRASGGPAARWSRGGRPSGPRTPPGRTGRATPGRPIR